PTGPRAVVVGPRHRRTRRSRTRTGGAAPVARAPSERPLRAQRRLGPAGHHRAGVVLGRRKKDGGRDTPADHDARRDPEPGPLVDRLFFFLPPPGAPPRPPPPP